ncbi:hypothetical protein ACIBM4_00635 [Streptomyces sp. NPDC050256]|uniref:hypothetical protein n=1 Tax=Streptomyces sp. NPDC050256 TaxID=3365607 RepID=UPI0037B48852
MPSLRTRSVLLAAALVAGTGLLTACQNDAGRRGFLGRHDLGLGHRLFPGRGCRY